MLNRRPQGLFVCTSTESTIIPLPIRLKSLSFSKSLIHDRKFLVFLSLCLLVLHLFFWLVWTLVPFSLLEREEFPPSNKHGSLLPLLLKILSLKSRHLFVYNRKYHKFGTIVDRENDVSSTLNTTDT